MLLGAPEEDEHSKQRPISRLAFFHRRLRRLIAIELKSRAFEPADKGQMEWYLNWLNKNERREGEEPPIGIILCAGKDKEDIEYLSLDGSDIHVAEYLTQLPERKVLESKFRDVVAVAREKYFIQNTNVSADDDTCLPLNSN